MESFVVNFSEIDGRLDCFFYKPEFRNLDNKVKSISKSTLNDYALSISGGMTPDIKRSDEYYTDDDNGVPFLRVQNVTEQGFDLRDVKYINHDTHYGILKRSQVKEGDLITKITGVGRMAVSSVAPKGFTANINQHLVVIKTDNEHTSRVLATFLNTDIGEKLAKKRSTGGTRPALDYKALRSIPIVFKPEIVPIIENAFSAKEQKESEADELLASISDYVLSELGIDLPKIEENRTYVITSSVIEKRIDPNPYSPKRIETIKAIKKTEYELKKLSECADFVREISSENPDDLPFIGLENIESQSGFYIKPEDERESFGSAFRFKADDVVFPKLRPYLNKVHLAQFDGYCSTEFHVLRCESCNPLYLFSFLNSEAVVNQTSCLMTGNTLPRLQTEEVENLIIPNPPKDIQDRIAGEVSTRLDKAKQLRQEAVEPLEQAKIEAEKLILGE